MISNYVREIRNRDDALRIPHKFYNYCKKRKLRLPKVLSVSATYLWIDMSNRKELDELLLEADFMSNQTNRSIVSSANAVTKAYNRNYRERKLNGEICSSNS